MRLPAVLSPVDLPEQELISASKDGELVRIGGAFCPVDTIIGIQHRASSIGAEIPARSIAERRTAAWIYGACLQLHRPLDLCVDIRGKTHPLSTRLHSFREVVIHDHEVVTIGELRVTSPLRTAVDIARINRDFGVGESEQIRKLSESGLFAFEDCARVLSARRNLPNKRVALQRLQRAFDV